MKYSSPNALTIHPKILTGENEMRALFEYRSNMGDCPSPPRSERSKRAKKRADQRKEAVQEQALLVKYPAMRALTNAEKETIRLEGRYREVCREHDYCVADWFWY